MESLEEWDAFSAYDLGILYETVSDSDNYIKIRGVDYIRIYNDVQCDLLIFKCNKESVLTIGKVSVKIKPHVTYYIKPYVKIDQSIFTVYSYALFNSVKLLHVEEKVNPIYKELASHIGSEKVLLYRWPFENVKLEHFLNYCNENNIEYKILLKNSINSKRFYEYNPEKKIGVDDHYDIKMYSRFTLEYNAIIFNGIGYRFKKVVHVLKRRMIYNGSSQTSASDGEDTEYENAVILFNPQTPTKDNIPYNILSKEDAIINIIDDYNSDTSEEDCSLTCEPYQRNRPKNTSEWNYLYN